MSDDSNVVTQARVMRRPSDDAFRFFTGGTIELMRLSRGDAVRVASDILELAAIPYWLGLEQPPSDDAVGQPTDTPICLRATEDHLDPSSLAGVAARPAPQEDALDLMLRDLRECGANRGEPCGVHDRPQWTCAFCLHNVLAELAARPTLARPQEVSDTITDTIGDIRRQCFVPPALARPAWQQALDALQFAHGAILDAIGLDDGLDGIAGDKVLQMIRAALTANSQVLPDWPGADQAAPCEPFWTVSLLPPIEDLRAIADDWTREIAEFATKDDPYYNGVRQCLSDLLAALPPPPEEADARKVR